MINECSECEEGVPEFQCSQCEEYLCENCRDDHCCCKGCECYMKIIPIVNKIKKEST